MRIFYFLYIFLVVFFISFLSIWNFLWLKFWNDFLLIYTIVIFPLIERVFNYIINSSSFKNYNLNWINISKYLFIICLFFTLFFVFWNSYPAFLWTFLIFSILFNFDARFSFFIALFLLIYVPIFLIIWINEFAEQLSISAYYFLIIWTVISIFENIYPNNNLENKS